MSVRHDVDIFEGNDPDVTATIDEVEAPVLIYDVTGESAIPEHGTESNTGANPTDSNTVSHDDLIHYPNIRRSTRLSKQTVCFGDTSAISLNVRMRNEDNPVPTTYREAVNRPEKDHRSNSIWVDIAEIDGKKASEPVSLPNSSKPIKRKQVYFKMRDSNNHICRFCARLVGKGFPQRQGIEYEATFAPVAK